MNNFPGAAKMRKFAKFIQTRLPEGWGMALVVFPYGEMKIGNYISTADRSTMIQGLRELADRLENNQDFKTPEEN
jgi:hypothetical protein